MKKLMCVLGIAAATPAMAQTNVTIYGYLDAGIRVDSTSNGTTTALQSGQAFGNRLGFRGTEDLGGGLQALFTLENGYNVDDGAMGQGGLMFGRQVFIGLSSADWGMITLGRQYTQLNELIAPIMDPFQLGMLGNLNNTMNLQNGKVARFDNAIVYHSPQTGKFRFAAGYALGESTAANVSKRAGDQIDASVSYVDGNYSAAYIYHVNRGTVNVGASPEQTTHVIGGNYNFGVAKLFASFSTNRNDASAAAQKIDRRNWSVGVSVPVSQVGRLLAQYQDSKDRTAANADSGNISIGYMHALSKRTEFYSSAAIQRNRNTAAFKTIDGTQYTLGTVAPGTNAKGLEFGILHRF